MYDLKIYLAGKMGGLSYEEMNGWRNVLKLSLEKLGKFTGTKVKIVNPVDYYNFEEKKYQSEKEVEDYDLAQVVSSDIVIVNLDGLSSSDGTKYEIFEAYRNHKIPVIAFGSRELYNQLHPWVKSKITRVEPDMSCVCSYIRDFYMM